MPSPTPSTPTRRWAQARWRRAWSRSACPFMLVPLGARLRLPLPQRPRLPVLANNIHTLDVRDLGQIDFAEALALQDQLVEQRLRNEIPDTLLLLEHPPVITLGRRGARTDVYASDALL